MLDASVLIDNFRARNKASTFYTKIIREYGILFISVIAKLEVIYGTRSELVGYWDAVFATMAVVPFTVATVCRI
jgi:predicted nucleic acid-binding protein